MALFGVSVPLGVLLGALVLVGCGGVIVLALERVTRKPWVPALPQPVYTPTIRMPPPRARCAWCGSEVDRLPDGTLQEHFVRLTSGRCDGSGSRP